MGTFMASASFRRTDSANWSDIKPKILAMYQDVEGLVSNLEQDTAAYAIVSPYGDLGMFLADIPKEGARMALCIIATGPILVVYPFFQKYFIQGLTVGAVKE